MDSVRRASPGFVGALLGRFHDPTNVSVARAAAKSTRSGTPFSATQSTTSIVLTGDLSTFVTEFAARVDGRKQADDDGRYGQRFILSFGGGRRRCIKPEARSDCRHEHAKDKPPHRPRRIGASKSVRHFHGYTPRPAPTFPDCRSLRVPHWHSLKVAYAAKKTRSTG